jgi:hypothetical protein
MNLNPPAMPDYGIAVLENEKGARDPKALRFNPPLYQFLQKMRQAMLAFPAAVIGTSKSGGVVVNGASAIITTEPLTTAGGGTYSLTLTNNTISDQSNLMVNVYNGSNNSGLPVVQKVTVGAGVAIITISNAGAMAFSGTLQIHLLVQ